MLMVFYVSDLHLALQIFTKHAIIMLFSQTDIDNLKINSPLYLTSGPWTINKSKFQTNITFQIVLILIQLFDIVFECTYCSHLQIIKTVCPIKFEIFKI